VNQAQNDEGLALRWWQVIAVAALVAIAAACSGGGGGAPAPSGPPPAGPQAKLDRAAQCDDLLGRLQADALAKIDVQAESLRASGWQINVDPGGFEPPVPAPAEGPRDDQGSGAEGGPDDFTETNAQEAGVDEADFVESDGTHVYALHGNALVVVDSWPPESTALRDTVEIEGYPHAMFVANGRAVVFSEVYDDTGELGADESCRGIGLPLPMPVREPGNPFAGDLAPCLPSFTKVTVLDVAAEPTVVREVYLEGYYSAARRHDAIVRVVMQGGLGVPEAFPDFWSGFYAGPPPANEEEFLAQVDAWVTEAKSAIEASDLDDWLPTQWERRDGTLTELPPPCSEAHIPAPGLSDHGMTRIVSFDMSANESPLRDALVLGAASSVYASQDTLVLAQPDWGWYPRGDEGDRTSVHVFSLEGDATTYAGSGFVPGVPLNQFAFDVVGDVLRLATTETRFRESDGTAETASQVLTTRLSGDSLEVVGSTGPLAPGERIFASRFLGDRAYLVTFRQIDPLFVIDVADPANPTVLGELELPGFSEYVHPLGDTHLLTIGRAADETGRPLGIALRIFDVSDPASPALADEHVFAGDGWSEANYDHRAFTFAAERGLLAFPYVDYQGAFSSTLQLFSVDVATGLSPIGAIDHSALATENCGTPEEWGCPGVAEVRRGLFIEDFVYSIGFAGILVHATSDLDTPVATVVLPSNRVLPPPVAEGEDPST